MLRIIGKLPVALSAAAYWFSYAWGAWAMLWAGMQTVEEDERKHLAFFAPLAVFFPGLLENGVILSGNIAYLVYGAVMVAALRGWRRGRWGCFYLAVLLASCLKAPLLTLLAIPCLSARNQVGRAALTAGGGASLFAVQRIVWPSLFQHFLQAVDLNFVSYRDFGASPAGLFAGFLFDHGFAYSRGGLIFYLLYASLLLSFLLYLSRKFLTGAFPLTRWMPVMLVGVILLDPRIIEYDLAPLTIPLAVIVWRLFPALAANRMALGSALATLALLNLAAFQSWIFWKDIACILLVTLFSAGAWQLLRQSQARYPQFNTSL